MHFEEGHHVVRCSGEESLHRAKSLVNLQFSWLLIGVAVFGASLYMVLTSIYGEDQKVEYFSLGLKELEDDQEDDDQDTDDVESQKKSKLTTSGTSKSFIEMGKSSFGHIDIER